MYPSEILYFNDYNKTDLDSFQEFDLGEYLDNLYNNNNDLWRYYDEENSN